MYKYIFKNNQAQTLSNWLASRYSSYTRSKENDLALYLSGIPPPSENEKYNYLYALMTLMDRPAR